MSERHFVWGPGSRWAEGPGSRRKGWENGESSYLYFTVSSVRGAGFTEVGWFICGLWKYSGLIESSRPPPPPRSQSSTCCSDACSDVALICRTRLSFAAFVRAVGQELLQCYVPGSLSWLRLLGLKSSFTGIRFLQYWTVAFGMTITV